MKIYVKLYATLAQYIPEAIQGHYAHRTGAGSRFEMGLPEGSTLDDLVTHLELPREQIKVIFVNAKAQDLDYRLHPGDEIGIFPPIGGG